MVLESIFSVSVSYLSELLVIPRMLNSAQLIHGSRINYNGRKEYKLSKNSFQKNSFLELFVLFLSFKDAFGFDSEKSQKRE